jgi:hypothetical protein
MPKLVSEHLRYPHPRTRDELEAETMLFTALRVKFEDSSIYIIMEEIFLIYFWKIAPSALGVEYGQSLV